MAVDRTSLRAAAAFERRPSVSNKVQCRSAEIHRSPAQTLQQRIGNRATQSIIARAVASQTKEPATRSKETEEKKKQPPVNVTSSTSVQHSKWIRLPGKVSKVYDPAELEAEETARKVMRMQTPPATKPTTPTAPTAPVATTKGTVQRAETTHSPAPAAAPARTASPSRVGISGGSPLPASVRGHMEPRFGANFSNVRIHTGEAAAHQSAHVNAHAFTVGDHIFFGRDKYQPDSATGKELIAHELTHTIQQQAVVQRTVDTTVTQHSEPRIQRLGISDALNWIADKANYLPGFRLLTIVLGMNPINMSPVDRSAANILRALLEMIPVTGALIAQALDSYGILAKVGGWVETQIRTLGMVGSQLKGALTKFLDSLSWTDIFNLDDVYERGKRIFTEPITRLINFGTSLVGDILGFIRQAILLPLAALAENTKGYDLIKAVLGQDPITGEAYPRTPQNLIGGFLKLIGKEEIWENAQKANAIPRLWSWFQAALQGLLARVRQIPALFMNALKSLDITDLLLPPKAFVKVAMTFSGFAVEFATWAGNALWTLLEIIFDVVSPGAFAYIKKTGAALKSILQNPLPFVLNLVRAAKLGFEQFADNIGGHLKAGLIDWLTGSLEGVYIPKALSLPELGKFALSVLGISWARIRAKIVKALGPNGETIMKVLETGFDIVVALVTGGPAAAWELIKEKLTELKDQVISGIIGFVTDAIVKKAIPKLIAMFIPGAGFISAIISIYDTIMVFVEKISKIIQVVKAFIDSIVAIAGGNITAAANRVEKILGNLLSLAISFLAGFLGLGKITDKIKEIIEKIRAKVDQGIDAVIAWIVDKAKAFFAAGKAAVKSLIAWWKREEKFTADGESHRVFFTGDAKAGDVRVASNEKSLDDFLKESKASGGDAATITLISNAYDQIKSLRKERKPPKPDEEDPVTDPKISAQFDIIAANLPKLFAGDKWGSETNPLQLEYPKKAVSLYRTLYIGPLVSGQLKQSDLMARASMSKPVKASFDPKGVIKPTVAALDQWIEQGGRISICRPFEQTPWPYGASQAGSGTLGVSPEFQAQPGTAFDYDKGSTPGGRKLNDALKKYGYFGRKDGGENSDGDHVLEAQLIGRSAADQIPNMWPLDKTENRHGENLENNATVSVDKRPELKFKGLLEASNSTDAKKTKRKQLRVMIKSTK